MTLDIEYMEKVRRIMADASSYYGDALLEPIERIAEKALDSPRHGLCLGRIMMVCADSDEEVGSKLENALRSIPGIENVECVSNTVV